MNNISYIIGRKIIASMLSSTRKNLVLMLCCASWALAALPTMTKRIFYVRHAQSRFNSPKSLADYIKTDAELSDVGVVQARELADWIEGKSLHDCRTRFRSNSMLPEASCSEEVRAILSSSQDVPWLSSNLKRALMTGVIMKRSKTHASEFKILSALQEVSILPDCHASARPFHAPSVPAFLDASHVALDASRNTGNANGLLYTMFPNERIRSFCNWTKHMSETSFVVVGHAMWLLRFFSLSRQSMDSSVSLNLIEELLSEGVAKLDNTAVLSFDIEYLEDGCRFVPHTAELVYGRLRRVPSCFPANRRRVTPIRKSEREPLVGALEV